MENLPDDVLSNILLRLLTKQLAQMRCISNFFNVFLSQSSFIKTHLDHSIHNNDESLLFFYEDFSFNDTIYRSRAPDLELTDFIKLPMNRRYLFIYEGRVIGSVNGLICFSYLSDVYIWNPTLSAVLPLLQPLYYYNYIIYRFGYDPKTDDYKVVRLENGHEWLVEVYSMRNGFWNSIKQKFPSHVKRMDQNGVCGDGKNGRVHWLGYTDTIVAFDLATETFSEIPFPKSILDYNVYDRKKVLGFFGGKLCVMTAVITGKFEMWVMDKYGVAESWMKNHVFSLFNNINPLGFTLHGEFLFQDSNNDVAIYNPVTTETKFFNSSAILRRMKFVQHIDSLVWVAPARRKVN